MRNTKELNNIKIRMQQKFILKLFLYKNEAKRICDK